MPILVNNGQSCLFLHAPKTGGSSFERAARRLGWKELLSIRGFSVEQIKFLRSSPQHFHAEILDQFINYDYIDNVIMLCRNPFSRVKSEYYWQRAQGKKPQRPRLWLENSFRLKEEDPFIFDNHLRDQIDFVPRNIKVNIFKLEDAGVSKALRCLVGQDTGMLGFAKLFWVTRWMKQEKKSVRDMEIEREFEDLKGLVADQYAADYEYFRYER